jgi:hypothetical protein
MKKLTLMKRFMRNFVGKRFHLVIKEREGTFKVHTIEIMQKTDETCPVKEIPVGDYFIHLVARDKKGADASIVCNWTDELLKSLMANYKEARNADYSQITMFRDPISEDPNRWLLSWGDDPNDRAAAPRSDPIRYIS